VLGIFIEVLVPVFLVLGIGFIVARTLHVAPQPLAALSYWVLGPVFFFSILSTADLEALEIIKIVAATVAAMVVVGGVAVGAAIAFGTSRSIASASILTSIHGNVGNFGLAISAFALGDEVLPIAGIAMVTINTIGILVGVGLATSRTHHWTRAGFIAITTPMALAVVVAVAVNITNLDLPIWIDRPVDLIGAAMIPVMLLTLGIQLAGMDRSLPAAATAVPITLKLVVNPLVALAAVSLVGLSGVPGQVVIIQSAMPAALVTSVIALEHDLEADFTTSVVLVGTLLSALTIPIVIGLL
jgi:predicted permease